MFVIAALAFFSASSSAKSECPIVLGHRGAAGVFPEHTVIAYEEGSKYSDYIECDVQISKDLELVCSHEAWIKEVCDVEDHPEFLNRLATYNFDDDDPDFDWNDKGDIANNFFTFDFTLEELRTFKRHQVNPKRDPNYNGKFSFVSFDEFVAIAKTKNVGIAPELKSPTAMNKILAARNVSLTSEDLLLAKLSDLGYQQFEDNCLIQCFELSTLERLKGKTELKRLFLLKRSAKTDQNTLDRISNSGIFSVCLDKELIVTTNPDTGNIQEINQHLIDKIHDLGMPVFAYTFDNELSSLKWDYGGDVHNELNKFLTLGLDGYFADYPNTVRSFLESSECRHAGNAAAHTMSIAVIVIIMTLLLSLIML